MRKLKIRSEIRRSLIEQAELLVKASRKGMLDDGLSNYSRELINIHKELTKPVLIGLGSVLLYFLVCFVLFAVKR